MTYREMKTQSTYEGIYELGQAADEITAQTACPYGVSHSELIFYSTSACDVPAAHFFMSLAIGQYVHVSVNDQGKDFV